MEVCRKSYYLLYNIWDKWVGNNFDKVGEKCWGFFSVEKGLDRVGFRNVPAIFDREIQAAVLKWWVTSTWSWCFPLLSLSLSHLCAPSLPKTRNWCFLTFPNSSVISGLLIWGTKVKHLSCSLNCSCSQYEVVLAQRWAFHSPLWIKNKSFFPLLSQIPSNS